MATGSPAVGEIIEIGGIRYEVTKIEKIENQLHFALSPLDAFKPIAPYRLVE